MIDQAKSKAKIEGWYTAHAGNGWEAPELAGICIEGKVGERYISTSRVAEVDGRFVLTRSGSVYELGEPDPEFAVKHGPIDPVNPIRVKR